MNKEHWIPDGDAAQGRCEGAGCVKKEHLTFLYIVLYTWDINKGVVMKKKKYLVLVSDLVARRVYVDASSPEEALEAANYGEWEIPADVESEEVVDRQAEEVLEEDC